MSDAIRFHVPGIPVAKGRARVTTIGGHARAYTPAKTVAYESTVALMARQAMGASSPMGGPLAVSIVATWPIPPSWPKKRQQAAQSSALPLLSGRPCHDPRSQSAN